MTISISSKHLVRGLGAVCLASSLSLLGFAAVANADDGGGGGDHGHVVTVKAIDRCDPASFNAPDALGPNACVPVKESGKTVTFSQLLASFDPVNHTASPAWRFSRTEFEIEKGDTIHVVNVGGEAHSFTEVPFFGGGCVDQVNAPLGLTKVAATCPRDFSTVRPPGGTADITGLPVGTHSFICVIHPWMKATVSVEKD
jgi:plastocyanin